MKGVSFPDIQGGIAALNVGERKAGSTQHLPGVAACSLDARSPYPGLTS